MSVTTEDKHESKLIHAGGMTVASLGFFVSLETSDTGRSRRKSLLASWACKCLFVVVCLEVGNVSSSFHLLVVKIKALISVFDDKRVLHRYRSW
jgi:hypothetical protein